MGAICSKDAHQKRDTQFTHERPPISCKIIVVGPTQVGKTTMIQTMMKKEKEATQASTTSEVHKITEEVIIGGIYETLEMQVWDTPGGDHFAKVNAQDYMNADVVVMVYSIDLDSTFDNMFDLYETAKSFSQNSLYFLIGNKSDMDKKGKRQVEAS